MNDTAIVTLRADDFEKDYELPCRISLGELYPRLTEVLQRASRKKFGEVTGVILEKNGAGLLREDASLWDYGICTGCILDIVNQSKYEDFQRENRR